MSNGFRSVMALAAISAIACGPAHVPPDNRPTTAEPPEPGLPVRMGSKLRFGWVKSGTGPKNRSKQERNKRKAVRRARARNAKGGR